MKTYKVTVKYECEVDYDVPAKSQKQADKMILTEQIGAAKYTDYRQTRRRIIARDNSPDTRVPTSREISPHTDTLYCNYGEHDD